jgi:hypothetical protein
MRRRSPESRMGRLGPLRRVSRPVPAIASQLLAGDTGLLPAYRNFTRALVAALQRREPQATA